MVHGYELGLIALQHCIPDESSRHVGLACPARSHEDDVVHLVKLGQLTQLSQLHSRNAGAVVEVEAVEVAGPWKFRFPDAPLDKQTFNSNGSAP